MSAFKLDNVSKRFAPQSRGLKSLFSPPRSDAGFLAVDQVSLTIEHGEFFGLLGPNGAGKTTLISMLAGLTRPTSGQISVCGYDVRTQYQKARQSLGVVPQEIVYDPFFTVRETLRLQSGYFGLKNNDDWIDEILANLALSDKADVNMRALSGGMKRRVLVAQALVHRPPVIILDEPTAGVDVDLRRTLWEIDHSPESTRPHHFADHSLPGRGPGPLWPAGFVQKRQGRSPGYHASHYGACRWPRSGGCFCTHHAERRENGGGTVNQNDSPKRWGVPQNTTHRHRNRNTEPATTTQNGIGLSNTAAQRADAFLESGLSDHSAPVLTALMYLLIFAHVLEGRVTVYNSVPYTAFLIPGLMMMSMLCKMPLPTLHRR